MDNGLLRFLGRMIVERWFIHPIAAWQLGQENILKLIGWEISKQNANKYKRIYKKIGIIAKQIKMFRFMLDQKYILGLKHLPYID